MPQPRGGHISGTDEQSLQTSKNNRTMKNTVIATRDSMTATRMAVIGALIDFVKANQIRRVVCLEISRLGRNTLEALKVIQTLNENHVSLYVKNYNLETLTSDGQVNPVASLICTILLEVASMELLTIRERMASGRDQYIKRCRTQGIKMGRPVSYRKSEIAYREQYSREISLLKKGISLRNVAAITGTSINTLRKIRTIFCNHVQ